MASQPIAVALTLCDHVIIDERTKKVSLIGCFNHLKVGSFPAPVLPFSVATVLTGGLGKVKIELLVSRLDTGAAALAYSSHLDFPDKLVEVLFEARLRKFVFAATGFYQFTLLGDGAWLAQRRFRLSTTEEESA